MEGAEEFRFEDNVISKAEKDSITLKQSERTIIRRNRVANALSQPVFSLDLETESTGNNCNDDTPDLKESDVSIVFSGNLFNDFTEAPIQITTDNEFSDNFVANKLEATNNSASVCNCTETAKNLDTSKTNNIVDKIIKTSHCTKYLPEEVVKGTRNDICNNNYETRADAEDRIRDDLKKKYTIYIVVAVIVTLILAIIFTVLLMRACSGGNNNDVTPRSDR